MALQMDIPALDHFIKEVFPQVAGDFVIDAISENEIQMRMIVSEKHLRPGGTISGPTTFTLADVSAYLMTLARIGPQALAVTTNASIDFMRKPVAGVDLIAKCRLLKLGRALSVSDVLIYSDGMDVPVARASLTYAIPPVRS